MSNVIQIEKCGITWPIVHGERLPFCFYVFGLYQHSRRYEEASRAGADGSGLALFERSEFSQTPSDPSNAVSP